MSQKGEYIVAWMFGDHGEGLSFDFSIYSYIHEAESYAEYITRKIQGHDFHEVHIAVITTTVSSDG